MHKKDEYFDEILSFGQNISYETEIKEELGSSQENENSTKLYHGLETHNSSVHEKNKCSICDYTSSNKSTLKTHIESAHEKKRPHKCTICDYSSSQKSTLKTHTRIIIL